MRYISKSPLDLNGVNVLVSSQVEAEKLCLSYGAVLPNRDEFKVLNAVAQVWLQGDEPTSFGAKYVYLVWESRDKVPAKFADAIVPCSPVPEVMEVDEMWAWRWIDEQVKAHKLQVEADYDDEYGSRVASKNRVFANHRDLAKLLTQFFRTKDPK